MHDGHHEAEMADASASFHPAEQIGAPHLQFDKSHDTGHGPAGVNNGPQGIQIQCRDFDDSVTSANGSDDVGSSDDDVGSSDDLSPDDSISESDSGASEGEVEDTKDNDDDDDDSLCKYRSAIPSNDMNTRAVLRHHQRPVSPPPQNASQLEHLLSSRNIPGRGLRPLERALQYEYWHIVELKEMKERTGRYDWKSRPWLQDELEARQRREAEIRSAVDAAKTDFSAACAAAGISNELWKAYNNFCRSLDPVPSRLSSGGGWSITCFEDHEGSYVKYDPDLELLIDEPEMDLGAHNFRCEATVEKDHGEEIYVVEFWPIRPIEPRSGTEITWGKQYPDLYRLAEKAAKDSIQVDNQAAQQLLGSLPDRDAPFASGWLFEYQPEPGRADHMVRAKRWTYRSAHRIPIPDEEQKIEDNVIPETERMISNVEIKDDGEGIDATCSFRSLLAQASLSPPKRGAVDDADAGSPSKRLKALTDTGGCLEERLHAGFSAVETGSFCREGD